VSHIQYTICRSGSYYYNRRVPKHAVQYYGQFIRCLLSTDIHEAKALIAKFAAAPGEPIDIRADLTREEFNSYVDAFIMHHPSLEKYMVKDEGIKLMYQDSLIVEELIQNFTAREVPILCVHDSIIVQEKYLDLAREKMKKATVKLLGVEFDFDQNRVTKDLVFFTSAQFIISK